MKRPIFNCREEFREMLQDDIIFWYRSKYDTEFAMNACAEPPEPLETLDITEVGPDIIYDLRKFDLWELIVDTRCDQLVDMEDPGNYNMKIKRFYRHGSEISKYVECDARLAAKFDPDEPYFIDQFDEFPENENRFFYQRSL